MTWLLDTCVVSEAMAPRPDARVLAWLEKQVPDNLYVSTITLGEVKYGIERLPAGRRRDALTEWFDGELMREFGPRALSVDVHVAKSWSRLRADASRRGRTPPTLDGLLAATAAASGLTVVTRNVADFEGLGVKTLNPWT